MQHECTCELKHNECVVAMFSFGCVCVWRLFHCFVLETMGSSGLVELIMLMECGVELDEVDDVNGMWSKSIQQEMKLNKSINGSSITDFQEINKCPIKKRLVNKRLMNK